MHQFDRDIALQKQDQTQFRGEVSNNWSINNIPNGGYLMAILANAMSQCSDKQATPVLTVNYLSRCNADEVRLSVEQLSQSKQFNRLQIRLIQEGREKAWAFGTFAVETDACMIDRMETSPPAIVEPEKCVAFPAMPTYTLFDQLDVRLDPSCAGWMQGNLAEQSELRGWVKFKQDRAFDIFALMLMADAFPPAVFASQGMVAWVPTLEFSVNVRKVSQTQWLQCVFRTRFITCGLLEEDGQMWDQSGELVAISRQIAQFRKTL